MDMMPLLSVHLGGFISNSTAVITDAAHMAIDVASFVISIAAMYLATKKPTKRLSFGYIRAGESIVNYELLTIRFCLFCRSFRCSSECINYMVSDWSSGLYGCGTLYQSKFRD